MTTKLTQSQRRARLVRAYARSCRALRTAERHEQFTRARALHASWAAAERPNYRSSLFVSLRAAIRETDRLRLRRVCLRRAYFAEVTR